jgi:hypothetical protein
MQVAVIVAWGGEHPSPLAPPTLSVDRQIRATDKVRGRAISGITAADRLEDLICIHSHGDRK